LPAHEFTSGQGQRRGLSERNVCWVFTALEALYLYGEVEFFHVELELEGVAQLYLDVVYDSYN
jgi:hypothetical protein